jgi:VWFA-related protein
MIMAAASQAPSAQEPPPAFRSGTRVVQITIAATRPPNKLALRDLVEPPITDLRATDLHLFDNGVEQTIASFENLGPGVASNPGTSQPQRLSIILLDTVNTPLFLQSLVRDAVVQMLNKLPPGDRIAILTLGETVHMMHDFSDDYASLRAAVAKYDGVPAFAGFDPRIRILDTLRALTEIAEMTKPYPGQKSLLWVTLPVPTQFAVRSNGVVVLELLHKDAAEAMRKLGVSNVVLYPINPGGVLTFRSDSMTEMAEQTGGKEFYGSNDIGALVRGAMDDAREGYSLTFVPRDYAEDGSFHSLRITTSRKSVGLRYRPGYVADRR